MDRFVIDNFWDEPRSSVGEEFSSFTAKLKTRIVKRIEIFERKTVSQLFAEKQLEKVKGVSVEMYELRIRITPPVRILGTLKKNHYKPFHIFLKKEERIRSKYLQTATERIKRYYT
ncbi:MAG: hypothetical protein UX81_C0032G0004 [Parcubacteria group bacterium GW2011_GWA2_47_12]|nr:MAG: hypothetical protein UX81_C0032G0004 [Parcubacteria group bacterium GW2011_GWA2_47_12]